MTSTKRAWYDERQWAALLGLLALIAAYLLGSRALDTGSWQQYFGTFLLVVLGINRLISAFRKKI